MLEEKSKRIIRESKLYLAKSDISEAISLILAKSDEYEIRKMLADATKYQSVLKYLTNDNISSIRQAVAVNPNVSINILKKLSEDYNISVKITAKSYLTYKNDIN